jgi:hypothetical protein
MLVCLYEDRPQQVAGLKILLLSLNRYCPDWPIRLRFPGIDERFRRWLEQFEQLTLVQGRLGRTGSYDVKPSVLLDCLDALKASVGRDANESAVLWMDTDVVVNGSLEFLADAPVETLIATQDPWDYADGSTHRCESWGLKAARSLHGPLNSSVVRVAECHRALMERWQALLKSEFYLAEQAKVVHERNHHLLSDQDALGALLASAEFADIPVRRLRHAREILQHHGAGAYQVRQRWQVLRHGLPPLVHAMGTVKPWKMPDRPHPVRQTRDYYERTYLELSPYLHLARQYRSTIDEQDTGWMEMRTVAGRLGSILSLGHPALKGAAQAVLHRVISGHASGSNG